MKILICSMPIFALVVIGSTVAIRTFNGDYENTINPALPETIALREKNRICFAKTAGKNHRLKSIPTRNNYSKKNNRIREVASINF